VTAGTAERSCPDEYLGKFMKLCLERRYENKKAVAEERLYVV